MFQPGSAAEAQLAAGSHTLSAHAVLISFRECSDWKATEDGASLLSERTTPEFEDGERMREMLLLIIIWVSSDQRRMPRL